MTTALRPAAVPPPEPESSFPLPDAS